MSRQKPRNGEALPEAGPRLARPYWYWVLWKGMKGTWFVLAATFLLVAWCSVGVFFNQYLAVGAVHPYQRFIHRGRGAGNSHNIKSVYKQQHLKPQRRTGIEPTSILCAPGAAPPLPSETFLRHCLPCLPKGISLRRLVFLSNCPRWTHQVTPIHDACAVTLFSNEAQENGAKKQCQILLELCLSPGIASKLGLFS